MSAPRRRRRPPPPVIMGYDDPATLEAMRADLEIRLTQLHETMVRRWREDLERYGDTGPSCTLWPQIEE